MAMPSNPLSDPRTDLTCLDGYKKTPFVPGYPLDRRTFFSPVDQVHDVLKDCISAAQNDLLIAMYGLDDDQLAEVIMGKVNDKNVNVTLVLDKSQSEGKHETEVLARVREGAPQTEVVIGNSEDGAIQHLKMVVVDGLLTVGGSTNWSNSGQDKQDNECTVDLNPFIAIEASHRIHAIRLAMLKQQGRAIAAESH